MSTTILVVDDDWKVRQRITSLLDDAGYDVITASDGAEALEQMRAKPPSITLLDMTMPGVDGWEVMEERRKDSTLQTVPVFIMTALEVASAEWAKDLGAEGLFRKPIDSERLLTALALHLK